MLCKKEFDTSVFSAKAPASCRSTLLGHTCKCMYVRVYFQLIGQPKSSLVLNERPWKALHYHYQTRPFKILFSLSSSTDNGCMYMRFRHTQFHFFHVLPDSVFWGPVEGMCTDMSKQSKVTLRDPALYPSTFLTHLHDCLL